MISFDFSRKGGKHEVLLTGIGGSIGNAILQTLEEAGSSITTISNDPNEAQSIIADFSDDAALRAAVEKSPAHLDALVLAHGFLQRGPVDSVSPADWRHLLDINLNSIYTLIHASLDRLHDKSSIVIISSTAGLDHSPIGGPHYTVSKWGLNGLVRHLCDDLGPRGIRINSICPGLVDNPMGRAFMSDAQYEACFDDIPMRRAAAPAEIASAVGFLLSDGASFISGANIPVSGGFQ
ncbi:SDR family NAD(P)-dependent oxidoreductase [Roseovarius pelagicus]|uniref:SDR family oxidoreductase n=1 Tax=Roseovarius pelagicus TaxID=2980108 RepID=A0ABY6D9J4_9RHOB|nr:SDR family oxidoreductase [Roseovarius pelagicus]UXX82777.1 SDR family oxidoreductase [Roseovarius pelagicus]